MFQASENFQNLTEHFIVKQCEAKKTFGRSEPCETKHSKAKKIRRTEYFFAEKYCVLSHYHLQRLKKLLWETKPNTGKKKTATRFLSDGICYFLTGITIQSILP